MTSFDTTLEGANALDAADPLGKFRSRFVIPRGQTGEQLIYFCGNSLGLQPKQAKEYVDAELLSWALHAVNGHFEGMNPWFGYHELCTEAAAHIVGALPHEVVMMNALTVNLHLLMTSFYRPTPERYKIVIEGGAFPSDRYAVASQAHAHGYDPANAVVELQPREGEAFLRDDDIVKWLEENGESVALVMISGVNYYTGQFFDMERITTAGHAAGAKVGFDLAHAAGNVELKLHDWNVDFAVWCSYKYMNSSPGGVGGAFVHDRHSEDESLARFAGWWGNEPDTRFSMPDKFIPQKGAGGWQLSNAPVLPMAVFRASGDMFLEATMPALRTKSEKLSAYLLALIDELPAGSIEVITPSDPARRGCQVSLRATRNAKALQEQLEKAGVVSDFRPPDVVRIAPVPLYNTFEDVWRFAEVLRTTVNA
ncbi:MAG: kynureninase [Bradymonadia bacterium]